MGSLRLNRLFSPAENSSQIVLFSLVLIFVLCLVLYPVLLIIFNSFQIGKPGAAVDVYSTKIYRLIFQDPPAFAPATALSTMTLLLIVPLIVLQRWLITKKQYTTLEGRSQPLPTRLGYWKYPGFVFVVLVVILLTIIPLAFLLIGTFMKLFGFFTIQDPWTLANWQQVLHEPFFALVEKHSTDWARIQLCGGLSIRSDRLHRGQINVHWQRFR
jgi:ABC-type Fe3+ transport system permease subunit